MNNRHKEIIQTIHKQENDSGRFWPSLAYSKQLEALKSAIGKKIYFVELKQSEINLGIRITDTAYELLDVIDFLQPDPIKGLAPHMIILDDGQGINLGRIARISLNTAFSPLASDILYQDTFLVDNLLYQERQLSNDFITARSKAVLEMILEQPPNLNQISEQEYSHLSPTDSTNKHLQQLG